MIKTAEVNGFTIEYDIEKLINDCKCNYVYDSESFQSDHRNVDWFMTEEQHNKALDSFIEEIKDLDETIVKLFEKKAVVTKKGLLARNRNQILLESGIILNYDDYHGSHAWNEPVLLITAQDKKCSLMIYDAGRQSPF